MDNYYTHAETILDVKRVATEEKRRIVAEMEAIRDRFRYDLTGVDKYTLDRLRQLMEDYYNAESKLLTLCETYKGELQTELAICIQALRRYAEELMNMFANIVESGGSTVAGSLTLTDTTTGKFYNVYISNGTLYMKEV